VKPNSHNDRHIVPILIKLVLFRAYNIGAIYQYDGRIWGSDKTVDMRGVDTYWQFDDTDIEHINEINN